MSITKMTQQRVFEIKEDKIIDILMHSATREDISLLRNDTKDIINAARNDLGSRIDKLETKVDEVKTELTKKIDGVKIDLTQRIDKLDNKIDKVLWFLLLSILLMSIFMQIALHLLK